MNQTINPDTNKSSEIVNEILEKIKTYETRMTGRLARWSEIAALYLGKTATQRENSKNSPNSTELYKAIRAMSNMMMRMLLGQKPPFELEALDIIGFTAPNKLIKAEHYLTNQMDLARFDKGCHRALVQLLLYGSVVSHMQYEPLRSSFLGRKRFITSYRPISLVNCAFALDAYDIEESGWVAVSDIQAKSVLGKLIAHDPEGTMYNIGNIKKAQAESEYAPHVNDWVRQRMCSAGYMDSDFKGGMERITYYGPLDCRHDNEEYCVEVVNRQFITRMEAYEGIRPVSISTINTIDIEPLGNGLGDLFGGHLRKIDDAGSALLNMVTLAGANMFAKQKSLADEDMEFVISNFGILNLESPDLTNIGPDARNVVAVDAFRSNEIQSFRQASGATDQLQALVNEDQATATAVSLAMNEAVRNLSVQTQILSPTLLKHYLQMALQNAQKYNTEPFVLNIGGAPLTIVPADLLIDVDIRIKTTTDQDFRPAKLKNIMAATQLMMSGGPNAIPGYKIDPGYAILEALKLLDVPNFEKSIQPLTEEDMLQMRMMAEINAPQEQGVPQGQIKQENMEPQGTIQTPAGQVLSAPGDQGNTTQAIREASVAGR